MTNFAKQYVIWCSVSVSCLLISSLTSTWKISAWILTHCFLLINMTDRMRLRLTQCSAKVPAAVFSLTGMFPSTQSVARAQTHQTTSQATPHFSPLTAASVSCICGGQADLLKGGWVLWYTACLAHTRRDNSIPSLLSCRLTGCSPSLPSADGYECDIYLPKEDVVFTISGCNISSWAKCMTS